MMRKKQIFRMLFGAFVACMAAACSNETDVLNGFPTDGNTISVNLRTNDIGAATRTAIATEDESKVESLSAYLFGKNESGSYTLEKVYNSLAWNSSDETHSVALTGIKERGPKKVYFVANGTSIDALKNVSGLSEAEFQALLMNKMQTNPATPLPMTAQAELTNWEEGVNNASIEEPAVLKRISARIDLKVDGQEGLTFAPTSIALTAAADSYIFPNEEGAYNGSEETVEISGTTLYPYEAAAGTVTEVTVKGTVTVGNDEREATFVVPFVNENYPDGIAIERNHRYTVHITRINGFYSVEATVTVSDWNTANLSGELKAGEELKMTATEFADEALGNVPATAIYPAEDDTKSATVELKAEDAKVYKIWVGSANIEAVTSWGKLPDGWEIEEPADTRAEYLWEKSYWTLTIPANDSQETKSLTIKAVNKLELAKDENTEKYVKITFTQKGKEETVDHSKNPLLKWAKYNLENERISDSYYGGSLYQWGRNHGFADYRDAMGTSNKGVYNYGVYNKASDACNGWYNQFDKEEYLSKKYDKLSQIRNNSSMFIMSFYGDDYWDDSFGEGGKNWDERAEKCNYSNSICPEGWRMPTKADFMEIWPEAGITTSSYNLSSQIAGLGTELREIEDECKYIIKWELTRSSNQRRALKISCLVVSKDFNESMISTATWNDENVVTRYFGTTGAIEAYQHKHIWKHSPNTNRFPLQTISMDIARPMPFGTWNASSLAIDNYNWYYWYESWYTIKYSNIQDAGATYEGAYWVSDENMIFRFRDNQGKFGENNTTSFFGTSYQPRHNAFAIRCITDNPELQEK